MDLVTIIRFMQTTTLNSKKKGYNSSHKTRNRLLCIDKLISTTVWFGGLFTLYNKAKTHSHRLDLSIEYKVMITCQKVKIQISDNFPEWRKKRTFPAMWWTLGGGTCAFSKSSMSSLDAAGRAQLAQPGAAGSAFWNLLRKSGIWPRKLFLWWQSSFIISTRLERTRRKDQGMQAESRKEKTRWLLQTVRGFTEKIV